MTDNPPLVLELLRYAATASSSDNANRIPPRRLAEVDDRQFQWVLKAGLGPLLYRATDGIDQVPAARLDVLRSADLTAQVRHGNFVDTACEIVDVCRGIGVVVTLLKGISISDQHYPAAHLRPMGDIDILVPKQAHNLVESEMLRRGYIPQSDFNQDEHSHHGAPLFHPERRVWVEFHICLFPESECLQDDELFSPRHVAANLVVSTFHGRSVNRLTNELQLIYLAHSWIRDLRSVGIRPSSFPPLFDAVYLLSRLNGTMDWENLLGSLETDEATASIYVMLAYLCGCEILQIAPPVISSLASSQAIVGGLELRIFRAALDACLVRGSDSILPLSSPHLWNILLASDSHAAKLLSLPWKIAFPSRLRNRYSVRYQLNRLGRLLRTRR